MELRFDLSTSFFSTTVSCLILLSEAITTSDEFAGWERSTPAIQLDSTYNRHNFNGVSNNFDSRQRSKRFFSPFSFVSSAYASCTYDRHRNGTCMQTSECRASSGIFDAFNGCMFNDGSTFGVCCLLQQTCGGKIPKKNNTYFASPNFPNNTYVPQKCEVSIRINSACFVRLDFMNFTIHSPVNGSCIADQFFVPELAYNVPVLCGNNNSSHIYLYVKDKKQITLRFLLGEWTGPRSWLIRVASISCNKPWTPEGSSCLQYYREPGATIKSFNYNELAPKNSSMMAGLDYTVCISRNDERCYIKWDSDFFSLSPNNGTAAAGNECKQHFVTIAEGYSLPKKPWSFDRFCGEAFSDKSGSPNATSIYSSSYPFNLRVRTSQNYSTIRKGFLLSYRQLQCLGPPIIADRLKRETSSFPVKIADPE